MLLFPLSSSKKGFPAAQTNYVYLAVSKQKGPCRGRFTPLCGRDRTSEIKARKINREPSSGLSSNRLMLRKASTTHFP